VEFPMKTSPRISIVTPSYQQGQFLEDCIRSVAEQDYPNVEHIVIDGGSTDGSADVIRKLNDKLAYWVMEPDAGQYDAVNKGFRQSTGEIMAWLNSDDKYTPWTLSVVSEIFSSHPEIEWLTTLYPLTWDTEGRAVRCDQLGGFEWHSFSKGANLPGRWWFARAFIQQESTFWRRTLWERAGAHVDASFKLAGDFELWARFFQYADLYSVTTPLGGFRIHEAQKTSGHFEEYLTEAEQVLRRYDFHPYGKLQTIVRRGLHYSVGSRPLLPRNRFYLSLLSGLARLSIFDQVKACTWDSKGNCWTTRTGYVA